MTHDLDSELYIGMMIRSTSIRIATTAAILNYNINADIFLFIVLIIRLSYKAANWPRPQTSNALQHESPSYNYNYKCTDTARTMIICIVEVA